MSMQPTNNGLATLSSGLLARKGQARPAMRSQGFSSFAPPPIEDLGWNDMGQGTPERPPPGDGNIAAVPTEDARIDFSKIAKPAVLIEREALAEQIAVPPAAAQPAAVPPAAVMPVSVATAARLKRETSHKGKAAFTLRLDSDRHLRLRLASAVTNRSAQALVAQAFDQFLSALPEVETIVAQLSSAKGRDK